MPSSRKAQLVKEDGPTLVEVGQLFQQVHRSAANAQRCKKTLITLAEGSGERTVETVCAVLLIILKQAPQLTADAVKRHYTFLAETSRAFRERFGSDELQIGMMRCVAPYHNANEKLVRLMVTATLETLLKTVDQANTSEERQDFYQEVAELLKHRVHDKCPQVREKAVAAIAAFQTGKKDCDVTQQLIALLCSDTCADVRRQILHAVAPRKEFLEGYFHGMMRCTRDTVARVRAEAWDALSRFPWRYITAYATAKNIHLPEQINTGLGDSNSSVSIACRAALTNSWLHRDCKDDCTTLLDPIACGYVLPSLAPFDVICTELLTYCQKKKPGLHFPLDLNDLNTSGLLMWKADCRLSCDTVGEDETLLLLPLEQFTAVLQDTIHAYARPDASHKVVKFRNTEDADNMLRILLSAFEIYDDNAYLAHTDNTTRSALMRLVGFLLKVVPDDDPALFVDVAVRSLKALTARNPEEAATTVTAALDSLFRSLKLPQRYALGYDDVEALGRKSKERQQELVRRKVLVRSGELPQEELDSLKEEMDRDEKFLLRMQLIVLAYLAHSQRGDAIPVFCSHIIQLGRLLDNEKVRVAATRSLGIQCLISPDTVHTFMPLLLADAQENVSGLHQLDATPPPLAAMGVVFDLVMEYGLKFFDTVSDNARRSRNVLNPTNDVEARLQHEQDLAEEDVHKVGSKRLLTSLTHFLHPTQKERHPIALVGFCKLLSCNRIPSESVPTVLAQLLLHYAVLHSRRKDDDTCAYLYDFLHSFFHRFAASQPKRQESVAAGGVRAFRVLLTSNVALATWLMESVAHLSDAFVLTQIRDIDPQTVRRVVQHDTAATAENVVDDDSEGGQRPPDAVTRANVTRSSMQSGRLLRELSRHSLHEHLAIELLLELATSVDAGAQVACMDVLEQRMYFYSKDAQPLLAIAARSAVEALADDVSLQRRLQNWLSGLQGRAELTPSGLDGDVDDRNAAEGKWTECRQQREEQLKTMEAAGFSSATTDFFPPPAPPRVASPAKVKEETPPPRKRDREMDFFDVETIVGARRKVKH